MRLWGGGAIYNYFGGVITTISNSQFTNNRAIGGDGASNLLAYTLGHGGAISSIDASLGTINNVIFDSNLAQGGDGATGAVPEPGGEGLGGALYLSRVPRQV